MTEHNPSRENLKPSTDRPRALAELQYNSLISADSGTSSEEDVADTLGIPADDAQSVLGISIGRTQTRLTSPRTPAIEKAAAIEDAGGFFGQPSPDIREADEPVATQGLRGDVVPLDGQDDSRQERTARSSEKTSSPTNRLPSPWRAGPKRFKRSETSRSVLREGLQKNRRRASSGPTTTSALDNWQKAFLSNLPSFSRPHISLSPSFSFGRSSENVNADRTKARPQRSSSLFVSRAQAAALSNSRESSSQSVPVIKTPASLETEGTSLEDEEALSKVPTLVSPPARGNLERSGSKPHSLRRSTSDNSLQTYRTLSRVSSLGDDSRFENVQEQVNSRIKAIRDSFQDTNIKLPSLPSLASLRAEFAHARSMSGMRRSSSSLSATQKDLMGGKDLPSHMRSIDPSETKKDARYTGPVSAGGLSSKGALSHPHFTKALAEAEGDLVILGGYRGSILRSADPPHRQLWVPIKVGLNIRKVDLEVGLEPEDDLNMEEKILPGGMLTHIGPVDIARRLFRRARACENARSGKLRVHDYGYDWRLDPLYLSRRLIAFLEKLPCNQPGTPKHNRGATVIAHSLGGLITRHAVNQRPDLFRGVLYAGVPTTCVNILGPLRNGDDVLLSSRVLTAQVNFTIRTSFALLPLDGKCFFNKETKEEYPVDFFDVNNWIDYRWSPCIARPLPPLTAQPSGPISGIISSMASVLPNFPSRKNSVSERTRNITDHPKTTAAEASGIGAPGTMAGSEGAEAVEKGNIDVEGTDNEPGDHVNGTIGANTGSEKQSDHASASSVATAVTVAREKAIAYLTRTLANVKRFKQELDFKASHSEHNRYPPATVIYGKSTPTVFGAKVASREAIKHADAYDELAFASGDGVVLARAAMLPAGYQAVRGGIVSSDRGHVTLLGDLEAVGKCLCAINTARKRGVGLGSYD